MGERRLLVRGLYRGLMYAARPIDSEPALRALLARPCPYRQCLLRTNSPNGDLRWRTERHDGVEDATAEDVTTLQGFYDEVLGLPEAICYSPPPPTVGAQPTPSIAALVRREFKSRLPSSDTEWEQSLQLGFDALKELSYVAGLGEQMNDFEAKDPRKRVDPRLWEGMYAMPRWNLRPGRVLVAHPRTPNDKWRHAVVLLLEYTPEQGALGLIINRPESLLKQSGTGAPPSYRSYVGGSKKGWYWLSRFRLPAAQTTQRRTGNIYYGCGNKGPKWEELLEWGPRALERQVRQGMWLLADVSTDVIFPRYPLFSNKFSEERNAARRSQFWGRLLELMGGSYAPLARLAVVTDEAHEQLHRRSVCCGGNDFHHQDDDDDDFLSNDDDDPSAGQGETQLK